MTSGRDADGRVAGERYTEMLDRAEQGRQLEEVHRGSKERHAKMAARMEALEMRPEEWLWEVQKRDLSLRRWAEMWKEQQWAINRLATERHAVKVALMELGLEFGHRASAEERNGRYESAELLREVIGRLKGVRQDMETVNETEIAKENEHASDQVREQQ